MSNTEEKNLSHASKAVKFGRVLYAAAKTSAIGIAVLVVVGAGQFGQYMASAKDVRNNAIANWVAANPTQKGLANQFISECVVGKPKLDRDIETKIIGVYECGNSIGAIDLVSAVKAADETVVSVAWPLSVIN